MTPEEAEALAKQNYKHPRVSLDDINASIRTVHYMDGLTFSNHANFTDHRDKVLASPDELRVLTICMIVLKNGWQVVGVSAPASPANYNGDHGRKLAYDRCMMQIWPLMGFALKDVLHATAGQGPSTGDG